LTPEDQLLLVLSRGTIPPSLREQALALLATPLNEQGASSEEQGATPLNWNSILERVVTEEVYPLFYRNLKAICTEHGARSSEPEVGDQRSEIRGRRPTLSEELSAKSRAQSATRNATDAIDAINARSAQREEPRSSVSGQRPILEQLRRLSKINSLRNTLLKEELVRVLKRLAEAGIPTIPLKGVALAHALYGDPSLRACVDLDILVPRNCVAHAYNLLLAAGYASEFAPGFLADVLLRHDIEYALRRDERGFSYLLELHWGVSWGGQFEDGVADDLWANADPTTVFGAPAYALSPEWQILFLAAHAARHQWQGLKWLVDLHELYSASIVDWEKLDR
jgi:hypothetical protein